MQCKVCLASLPSSWSRPAPPPPLPSINWCVHLNHVTSAQFFSTRIKEKYAEEIHSCFKNMSLINSQRIVPLKLNFCSSFYAFLLSMQQILSGLPNFLLLCLDVLTWDVKLPCNAKPPEILSDLMFTVSTSHDTITKVNFLQDQFCVSLVRSTSSPVARRCSRLWCEDHTSQTLSPNWPT